MRLSQSFKVFYLQELTMEGLRLIEESAGKPIGHIPACQIMKKALHINWSLP